jgi:NAD(P)-dependent dehydrogenase (short-subunit alcohol dehydrogenase family)/thioesterase domain-containing protein/acyl carrier protein
MDRVAAGTVLITGGTSGVGAELARHLVAQHGVRQLVLTSRRGEHAPGARELEQELAAMGASVRIAACDMSDREQVEAVLGSVPAECPLTGVVHAAGIADNSLIASMDTEQIDRVLAPKLDAALHLHELTHELDLGLFVLCSSLAATFGGPGQANYAAANAFLDALAAHRRASGLAGVAVAWGIWERVGMTRVLPGGLEQLLRQVSGSTAFRPFSAQLGLELFDAALATALPMVVASPYRADTVRQEVVAGIAPRIMSGLVRSRPPAAGAHRDGSLQHRQSGGGDEDRHRAIVDEIAVQIATALGYESPDSIQMDLSFLELGFDSLVSLELRKRLQSVTGLPLPSTIMFDHPTPAALVDHLEGLLNGNGSGRPIAAAQPAANGQPGAGTVTAMFRRAHQLGKLADGVVLAEAAARLRPRFGLSHADDRAPAVIPLATGEAEPIVFCIPSLVATSGPHEYARFAKSFRQRRDIVAVPVPGFGSDELLPSTLDAVVTAQTTAIRRYADGRPVAILGYSTGGLLAHAVASECAREGITPSAVVLIDSYTMDTMWRVTDPVFDRMLAAEGSRSEITEDTLMAMGTYLGMLATWAPTQAVAPTLLVKASDPMPGVVDDGDWTATWTAHHTTVEVPGSHLTMLEEHADSTARAIEEWLLGRPRGGPRRGRMRRLHRAR